MLERATGDVLGISVPTAVPIEKLLELDKPIKEKYIYFNLRTLVRNYLNSFEDPYAEPVERHAEELLEEISIISSIVENQIKTPLVPLFYLVDYGRLEAKFPFAKFKVATTAKQKDYVNLEVGLINLCAKGLKDEDVTFKQFKGNLHGSKHRALVVTHHVIDLLTSSTFREMKLLESHTGEIKDYSRWGEKLTGDTYSNLPFNALTLQCCGDGSTMFMSKRGLFTKELLKLAERKRWTPSTKIMKVKFDIKQATDLINREVYLEMLSRKYP